MTSVTADAIRSLLEQDKEGTKAKQRFLERIQKAPDRGTKGAVSWTRDELHER